MVNDGDKGYGDETSKPPTPVISLVSKRSSALTSTQVSLTIIVFQVLVLNSLYPLVKNYARAVLWTHLVLLRLKKGGGSAEGPLNRKFFEWPECTSPEGSGSLQIGDRIERRSLSYSGKRRTECRV